MANNNKQTIILLHYTKLVANSTFY